MLHGCMYVHGLESCFFTNSYQSYKQWNTSEIMLAGDLAQIFLMQIRAGLVEFFSDYNFGLEEQWKPVTQPQLSPFLWCLRKFPLTQTVTSALVNQHQAHFKVSRFVHLVYNVDFWNNSHLQKSLVFGISCICHSLKLTDTKYGIICLDVAEHSIGSHWMGWQNTTWHDESMNPFAYMLQLWFCWSTGCMRKTNIYEYVKGQKVHTLEWVWKEIKFCGFSYKEIFPQKVSVLGQAAFVIKDSHDSRG